MPVTNGYGYTLEASMDDLVRCLDELAYRIATPDVEVVTQASYTIRILTAALEGLVEAVALEGGTDDWGANAAAYVAARAALREVGR